MQWLMWTGAVITLLGLAGLLWVISQASKLKGEGLDDAEMKRRLERLTAPNLASLAVATLGLMCVVIGIVLG